MRTTRKRVFFAAPIAAVCLLLAACGSSSKSKSSGSSSAPASATSSSQTTSGGSASIAFSGAESKLPSTYSVPKPSKPFTIGFQEIVGSDPSTQAEVVAARAEAKSLGGSVIVKDDQGSPSTQVSNCNTLLVQKVNAIIVYPFDPKALGPCFAQAAKQHVAIIAENTPINSTQPLPADIKTDVLQGFDNAAYLRAKEIATVAPGSTFAYIGLGIPLPALIYAKQRMLYWAKEFGLKFVGEVDAQASTAADGATAMNSILATHPTVGTVFCFDDPVALAAATAARGSGHSNVRVVGYNGLASAVDAVKAGTLFATVEPNLTLYSKDMVLAAVGSFVGTKLPKFTAVPNTVVTKANANAVTAVG